MYLRIQKLDQDDYDAPHVELFISGDDFAARQDSFVRDDEWLEFALALKSYPKNIKHEVIFESGAPEAQYYCYILLRVFSYDGVGHSALEVKINNPSTPPYKRLAHFYILGEAATFNRLGQSLEEWVRSKEPQFVFSTAGDHVLGTD